MLISWKEAWLSPPWLELEGKRANDYGEFPADGKGIAGVEGAGAGRGEEFVGVDQGKGDGGRPGAGGLGQATDSSGEERVARCADQARVVRAVQEDGRCDLRGMQGVGSL